MLEDVLESSIDVSAYKRIKMFCGSATETMVWTLQVGSRTHSEVYNKFGTSHVQK